MRGANRDPRVDYKRAHIPGARFMSIDDAESGFCLPESDLPHMLPTANAFSVGASRKLGVRAGKPVVVYTAELPVFCASARAWWMFRTFGKSDVYVLDGGLSAWAKEGLSIEHGSSAEEDECETMLGF